MFGQSLLSAFGIACTTDTDQLFTTDQSVTSTATYQLNSGGTSIPSNTYPLTTSNVTYTAGKFGNAATFTGSNAGSGTQLSVSNSIYQGNTSIFSVSLWVKCTNTVGEIPLSGNGGTIGGTQGYALYLNNGSLALTFRSSNGSQDFYYGSSINDNAWHNVVLTFNNGPYAVYLDGTLDFSGTTGNFLNNTTPSFNTFFGNRWGRASDNNAVIAGQMDQIRVFGSTVLPQSAVTALYNETTTTAQSASIDYVDANPNSVAYYKMSDATDQLGNHNGTASNVNFNTEGKFGFAGYFNGSSSYIQIPNNSFNYSTMTFSAWVNPSANDTYNYIFHNGMYDNRIGGSIGWYVRREAGGSLLARGFSANSLSVAEFDVTSSGGNIIPLNTWTNVVCVLTPTSFNIYINGSSTAVASATFSNSITYSASQPAAVHIGATYYYNNAAIYESWWEGKIDQIRIYNAALSASNISTLYKEVECEPAAINALDQFNTVLYTGNGSTQAVTGVGFKPDLVWIKSRSAAFNNMLTDSINGGGNFLAANGTGVLDSNSSAPTFDSNGFTLGGGNSNWNNSYTYVSWNWKAPLANLSTSFNGSSSISTNLNLDTSSAFTWSCWINIKDKRANQLISEILTTTLSSSPFNGLTLVIDSPNLALAAGGSNQGTILSNPNLNQWYHIAITYNGSGTIKCYVDNGTPVTISYTLAQGGTFGIGDGPVSSWLGYVGKIDQIRIYDSALSASQVSDLYTEPAASNNTLNYPAGAGCIAAYPLQTDAVDLSGNYSGASSNVTFGQPGYLTGNTNGTIPSTVAANPEAGFSIVKFTAPSSGVWTYGHQLNVAPELMIIKNITQSGQDWQVFLPAILGNNKKLILNASSSEATTGVLNNTNPTNTVITQTGYGSGTDNIAYCFTSIPGYSKIGSYVGTGGNQTIYVGFEPRFVLIKRATGGSLNGWVLSDSKRGAGINLFANTSGAEVNETAYGPTSFTSSGFTLAQAGGNTNISGSTYIFMAIA